MDSVGTWKLVSIMLRICYIVCGPQHNVVRFSADALVRPASAYSRIV